MIVNRYSSRRFSRRAAADPGSLPSRIAPIHDVPQTTIHAHPNRGVKFCLPSSLRPEFSALALLVLVLLSGCTRSYYRLQADKQVYGLVNDEPRYLPTSPTDTFTVQPDRRARFFDPNNPDRPPMPPDDPVSHKYMHWVDGKHGFRGWHRNGSTPFVASPDWEAFLPYDEDGKLVLDLVGATQAARLNSRNYQNELEDLYLSALDVTFERFRFDAQFFGGNATNVLLNGSDTGAGSQTTWNNTTDLQMQKLFANGGTLVVNLANSITWQVSGQNDYNAFTLLDFSLFQPLLRGFSRARVLERLTVAERTLLSNARQMERYQQGFVTEIATGVNAGQGPSRRGGLLGGSGFDGFSGVGSGGFGQVGNVVGNTGGLGNATGGAGAGQAGGFWGRLQDLQQIHNQEANVASLRASLTQLELSGIDKFQVDQARQALYNAQSVLLTSRVAYQDALDAYKITLGLPPHLEVKLDEKALRPFQLIDPDLAQLQIDLDMSQIDLRAQERNPQVNLLEVELQELANIRKRIDAHMKRVDEDFAALDKSLEQRRKTLEELAKRQEFTSGEFDIRPFDRQVFDQRIAALKRRLADVVNRIHITNGSIARVSAGAPTAGPAVTIKMLVSLTADLSAQLQELLLEQARARMESVDLVPINLTAPQALAIASRSRLDWMNARASLVDSWRLIEFNANDLEAGLNIVADGDITTRSNELFGFRGKTGNLRLGLEWDAPLTRLAERNNYRQTLIDYQRARRGYMAFEDGVSLGLRTELRTIQRNRVNFELRRAAIETAITQVDLSREKVLQPPPPAQPGQTPQRFTSTTARDLLSALSDLLQVQNDFLSVWINYEVTRMVLDRDMGTLKIDDQGRWIDPGPVDASQFEFLANCPPEGPFPKSEIEMLPPAMDKEKRGKDDEPPGATLFGPGELPPPKGK